MQADFADRIRFVLTRTSHPGNIGAAARAIKTMGLQQLVLVAPKQFPSSEATAMAAGADDLLVRAEVCDSLADAVAGSRLVYGLTARDRAIAQRMLSPRDAAAEVAGSAPSGMVSFVFGNERAGLSNDELALCRATVHISANPEYRSLNLAQAVQIMAYELHLAQVPGPASVPETVPASSQHFEGFIEHLEATLRRVGFLDPKQSETMMLRLRRLYARAQPDEIEIHILRGILSAIQRSSDDGSAGPPAA